MNLDFETSVRRIARFVGITLDDALFEIVCRQSSLEFMLAHKDRFDDRLMRERSERVIGLPPGSDSAKVRKGRVGEHRSELTPEISAEFDRVWLARATGYHALALWISVRDGPDIETPVWREGTRVMHRNRTKLQQPELSRLMERLRAEARLNS